MTARVLWLLLVAASAAAQTLPRPDHIVVVILENKGFTDVMDPSHVADAQSRAAYLNNVLRPMAAVLTKSYALHHPSQPNYLELFTGTNAGKCTDDCFTALKIDNLAARIRASKDAKHNSFIGYAEHFATTCDIKPTKDQYVQRHCPWRLVTGLPADVSKDLNDFPNNFKDLPAVAFVIPDLFGDMHSVDRRTKEAKAIAAKHPGKKLSDAEEIALEVGQGDTWLRSHLDAYARWAVKNNSLLIITWDEDSTDHPHIGSCADPLATTTPPENRILTLIIGAHVTHGESNQEVTHHHLLSTILALEGLPPIDASAAPFTGIWQ
jgi:acid phosphatase